MVGQPRQVGPSAGPSVGRQRRVSGATDRCPMPEQAPDPQAVDARTVDPRSADLLHRLVTHDAGASAEILARSATSVSPDLLVAAAILANRPSPALDRA